MISYLYQIFYIKKSFVFEPQVLYVTFLFLCKLYVKFFLPPFYRDFLFGCNARYDALHYFLWEGELTTTWYQPSKLHEDLQETTLQKFHRIRENRKSVCEKYILNSGYVHTCTSVFAHIYVYLNASNCTTNCATSFITIVNKSNN